MYAIGDDLPNPNNRVTIDPSHADASGLPAAKLFYAPGENDRRMMNFMLDRMEDIATAAGAFEFKANDYRDVTGVYRTPAWHMIGTCRMGVSPEMLGRQQMATRAGTCPICSSSTAACSRPVEWSIRPPPSPRWLSEPRPTYATISATSAEQPGRRGLTCSSRLPPSRARRSMTSIPRRFCSTSTLSTPISTSWRPRARGGRQSFARTPKPTNRPSSRSLQIARGAVGQCVQKVAEAEILAWGGVGGHSRQQRGRLAEEAGASRGPKPHCTGGCLCRLPSGVRRSKRRPKQLESVDRAHRGRRRHPRAAASLQTPRQRRWRK